MPNELRVRQNFVGGIVEDNPLTSVATTLTSAALAILPVVGATQHYPIVLDPDGIYGEPEIVWVTAHAPNATSATILRAQEGTTARQHNRDMTWVHGPTLLDVPEYPTRYAKGFRSAAQSIPHDTWTVIQFNAEVVDLYGILDITTNAGRFTPGKTGIYMCAGHMGFLANGTNRRGMSVAVNGTIRAQSLGPALSGGDSYAQITTVVALTSATDYIDFRGFQDSGVSINTTGTTEVTTQGSVTRIGDV